MQLLLKWSLGKYNDFALILRDVSRNVTICCKLDVTLIIFCTSSKSKFDYFFKHRLGR